MFQSKLVLFFGVCMYVLELANYGLSIKTSALFLNWNFPLFLFADDFQYMYLVIYIFFLYNLH